MIPNKGVPSRETFWYPAHDGNKWRSVEARWNVEDILNHIFPRDYSETYHKVATLLMNLFLQNPDGVDGDTLGKWIKEKGLSKATIYNRVLPKLRSFGLIKRERLEGKSLITPSLSFASHLIHVGNQWIEIVKTARADHKEKMKEKFA